MSSADLITRLIEAGTPAALVGEVAVALARGEEAHRILAEEEAQELARIADRRAKDAERKRRERARPECHADAAGQGVTPQDSADTPAPSPLPDKSPQTPKINPTPHPHPHTTRARGARLDPDFQIPEDWLLWAMKERGWSRSDAETEASSFHDHWVAKPGKDGCKLDWAATWRNWTRNSRRQAGNLNGRHPPPDGLGSTARAALRVFGSG